MSRALPSRGRHPDRETGDDGRRHPRHDDKCPSQPETHNGYQDDDGCPDRGRVIVKTSATRDPRQDLLSDRRARPPQGDSDPISTPSPRPEGQSADHAHRDGRPRRRKRGRRARHVRATCPRVIESIVGKASHARASVAHAYGATHPSKEGHDENSRAANRHVGFLILKRADEPDQGCARRGLRRARRSVRAAAARVESGGTSRYEIRRPSASARMVGHDRDRQSAHRWRDGLSVPARYERRGLAAASVPRRPARRARRRHARAGADRSLLGWQLRRRRHPRAPARGRDGVSALRARQRDNRRASGRGRASAGAHRDPRPRRRYHRR